MAILTPRELLNSIDGANLIIRRGLYIFKPMKIEITLMDFQTLICLQTRSVTGGDFSCKRQLETPLRCKLQEKIVLCDMAFRRWAKINKRWQLTFANTLVTAGSNIFFRVATPLLGTCLRRVYRLLVNPTPVIYSVLQAFFHAFF